MYWLRYDVQLLTKLGVHQLHWPGRVRCCCYSYGRVTSCFIFMCSWRDISFLVSAKERTHNMLGWANRMWGGKQQNISKETLRPKPTATPKLGFHTTQNRVRHHLSQRITQIRLACATKGDLVLKTKPGKAWWVSGYFRSNLGTWLWSLGPISCKKKKENRFPQSYYVKIFSSYNWNLIDHKTLKN